MPNHSQNKTCQTIEIELGQKDAEIQLLKAQIKTLEQRISELKNQNESRREEDDLAAGAIGFGLGLMF